MAQLIPFDEIEQDYAKLFGNDISKLAKQAKMDQGILINC